MRWLMIALLVSIVALLIASAGVAHHVWRERKKRRQAPASAKKAMDLKANLKTDPDTEEAP